MTEDARQLSEAEIAAAVNRLAGHCSDPGDRLIAVSATDVRIVLALVSQQQQIAALMRDETSACATVIALRAEVAAQAGIIERLAKEARAVLKGFGANVFVRDISHDHESGWAIRLLPYIDALARLEAACAQVEPAAVRAGAEPQPKRCPRCDSPSPELHPSVQWEGEVQPCSDPWHSQPTNRSE